MLLSDIVNVLVLLGRFLWWGGGFGPSVPRSPGVSPQEGRVAHGPRHCGTQTPRDVIGFIALLLCLSKGLFSVLCMVPFFRFLGWNYVWSFSLSKFDICEFWVSSLFLLLSFFVGDVCLSLLFFSQALGTRKPFSGLRSCNVSSSWPRSSMTTRTPFFSSKSPPACVYVFLRGRSCWVSAGFVGDGPLSLIFLG